jgi:hypothetical protein
VTRSGGQNWSYKNQIRLNWNLQIPLAQENTPNQPVNVPAMVVAN